MIMTDIITSLNSPRQYHKMIRLISLAQWLCGLIIMQIMDRVWIPIDTTIASVVERYRNNLYPNNSLCLYNSHKYNSNHRLLSSNN